MNITIGELFTNDEIARAVSMLDDRKWFHANALVHIVEPAMSRINAVTGQQNDPDYMAYVLEAICQRIHPKQRADG